ncbi:MAG TPA: S8 family serine peptidase, partial [Solirubrobacterales bacterium]
IGWRDHGTAVIGEFGGDRNAIGVTGISPNANTRAISIFGSRMGSAQAITQAANALSAGDIILIELHAPGPRHGFENREDQLGYIGVEWWPDNFDAIRYATGRGVIVVEAAGNGAENLDDALYEQRPADFPPTWTNPFNRANRDSGAIVVGAGAPPPGTHGHDHGPDRSRLDFSNYGALIDAQGWGREVTTCGYGDLQGGGNEDIWYTDEFAGTSSASPILVGTLAALQGVARANGQTLTPADCRAHLRATGSPQQAAADAPVSQRIGNRPDLRALIARISPVTKRKLEKIEWNEKVEPFELKTKEEKVELKEKREKLEDKEKREKVELKEKEKWELKEKPEKSEFDNAVQRGNLLRSPSLRAPGFSAALTDETEWGKEKLDKGEKEAKGEQKDKDEKREKFEKDEKGEPAEAPKQEKDDKDYKDTKDEKGDKDKERKDEKGEQDGKEVKDTKDTKDEKYEKIEFPDQKQPYQDTPEKMFRRQGKVTGEGGLDQRLTRLENLVSHFIDPKLRPDLSEGALTNEPDAPKLGEEAAAAMRSKVAADTKLSEA